MAKRSIKKTVSKATRSFALGMGRRFPALKATVRAQLLAARERGYRSLWRSVPVDPSVAVFESMEARGYSCSPHALYRAMLNDPRFDGVEKIWALRGPMVRALEKRGGYDIRGLAELAPGPTLADDLETVLGATALEELRHAVIVPWRSAEYRRSYARAALWSTNTVLPAYLVPRPGQTYLQAWHGTPLKRLGCDIDAEASGSAGLSVRDIHARYRREGARFTWLLSPSRYATDRFVSAFDLAATGRTGAIIEEGYPRNDFLHTFTPGDAARIKARLGVPAGKKVILYAPTWRENQHVAGVGYTLENAVDFGAMRAALGDDYVVLFRAHCLISRGLDLSPYDGFVVDVSAIDDINDLYAIADVLITDYSSVFFDYANLRRPVLFFMDDLEQYAGQVRGLYLDLDELPGPVVHTTADLIAAVRAAENPSAEAVERLERFRERFACLDDGHASERVLGRMLAEGAIRPKTDSAREGGGTAS